MNRGPGVWRVWRLPVVWHAADPEPVLTADSRVTVLVDGQPVDPARFAALLAAHKLPAGVAGEITASAVGALTEGER